MHARNQLPSIVGDLDRWFGDWGFPFILCTEFPLHHRRGDKHFIPATLVFCWYVQEAYLIPYPQQSKGVFCTEAEAGVCPNGLFEGLSDTCFGLLIFSSSADLPSRLGQSPRPKSQAVR